MRHWRIATAAAGIAIVAACTNMTPAQQGTMSGGLIGAGGDEAATGDLELRPGTAVARQSLVQARQHHLLQIAPRAERMQPHAIRQLARHYGLTLDPARCYPYRRG